MRFTGTVEAPPVTTGSLTRRAEEIAEQIALQSVPYETKADRRRRKQLGRLIAAPNGRDFLIVLTDQVLRVPSPAGAARLLKRLATGPGPFAVLGPLNGAALAVAGWVAPALPRVVVPAVEAYLRRELSALVFPAEAAPLSRHIRRRRAKGVDLNINLLGEAVLGHDEAEARTEHLCELLRRPDVGYVSVKISSVCAQLDVLAYDNSLARICARLRRVFAQAMAQHPAKFVNLDMEEYRDLSLTVDAFMAVLSEPEFVALDAGIVLQAYLPDSHQELHRLLAWARERHLHHGSSVKVRLVKGANLAMERVEAELRGWSPAPYATKEEVDASFKRLLGRALDEANAGAVRIGWASHNLFDIGWALAAKEERPGGVELRLEMLEGMANPEALAVRAMAGSVLLYTPVVPRTEFSSAVAYLVRRFDENTSPENFLAQLSDLAPGNTRWEVQRQRFGRAVQAQAVLGTQPRRDQDRAAQEGQPRPGLEEEGVFFNAPDTDFAKAANRDWVGRALQEWRSSAPTVVPALVAGEVVESPLTGRGRDPSRPGQPSYRYVEADEPLMARAVAAAVEAGAAWAATPARERRSVLYRVAALMERQRGQAVATMVFDGGKTVGEADPEVSEAVDFARYYGDEALRLEDVAEAGFDPYRLVVVAPPWNFPYAIPAGGVFAALAAGCAVVLKPAPETVLVAWLLVRQCHEAGLPKSVVQLLPCADADVGQALICHPDVDAVILTGAFDTARRFLQWRPNLALHAETSGKNAIVVSGSADVDDAIRDLLLSAFSHSGQKCSAASVGIIQAALYDDPHFRSRLADATRSLRVGPADDPATQVGPLVRPPQGRLLGFLKTLAEGESWLVEPAQVGDNPHLWRPGVKLGVAPGSQLHLEECFGPVLGLMRYETLEEAISLQNAPIFGLTGGLHSLDPDEAMAWCGAVEVGNAYVNRHTTGAIVRRQPFGGWKRSCVGRRAKAGGPNYVPSLGTWHVVGGPAREGGLRSELVRVALAWPGLARGDDVAGLAAEANVLRLCPLRRVVLRLGTPLSDEELAFCLGTAAVVGTAAELSVPDPGWAGGRTAVVETDDELLHRLALSPPDRVRAIGVAGAVTLGVVDAGSELVTEPVVGLARHEILCWSREQVVAWSRHRHGNIRPCPLDGPGWAALPPA